MCLIDKLLRKTNLKLSNLNFFALNFWQTGVTPPSENSKLGHTHRACTKNFNKPRTCVSVRQQDGG